MKSIVAALACWASATALAQQSCDDALFALSSPTARFHDHGDGTVTDRVSRLMWMRCSVGQTWSSGTCVGGAGRHTWRAALEVATELNRHGSLFFADWRLPQIRELASIAERECANPRINLAVFPNTPAESYWTATTRPAQTPATAAFALSFAAEGVSYRAHDTALSVRLVRDDR